MTIPKLILVLLMFFRDLFISVFGYISAFLTLVELYKIYREFKKLRARRKRNNTKPPNYCNLKKCIKKQSHSPTKDCNDC